MTLPTHLRTLLPNALDVLRYYQRADVTMAGIDEICQEVGLSERGFGKAIRSLVTKGYVIMDGDQVYRLTEHGSAAAADLAGYEGDGADDAAEDEAEEITRRVLVVMPRQLEAGRATHVVVGFEPMDGQAATADMVARLSVINGEPSAPQEATFELGSDAAKQDFLVTAGAFAQARIKVEIFQLGPNPGDIAVSGGLYVDTDVTAGESIVGGQVAYGADVVIKDLD